MSPAFHPPHCGEGNAVLSVYLWGCFFPLTVRLTLVKLHVDVEYLWQFRISSLQIGTSFDLENRF